MGAFDQIFNISSSQRADVLGPSVLDLVSGFSPAAGVLALKIRQDLEQRNIRLDLAKGPMGGAMSFIFNCANCPKTVVRIGQNDNPPDSALVLKSAAHYNYDADDCHYQVHVLPFAPDEGEVAMEDIVNSVRVLKAEGLENNLVDITSRPFVYLRGPGGDFLRYPETTADAAMRGRPIAFIRDLNALYCHDLAERASGMGETRTFLAEHGVDIDALPPAPPDCVAACRQQDALAMAIQRNLARSGARLAA